MDRVTCQASVRGVTKRQTCLTMHHITNFILFFINLPIGFPFSLLKTQLLDFLHVCQSSVQFSSVAQSCPTLCDPMDCSEPGLPVHHQLLEFTQTHFHRVGDAIQSSISSSVVPSSSCPTF